MNTSEWANNLQRTAGAAIDLLNEIDALYKEMEDSAHKYHELFYANEDPPQTPPPISTQEAMKNWLSAAGGVVGEFPALTRDDYWLAALALNGIKNSISDEDSKSLYWIAS